VCGAVQRYPHDTPFSRTARRPLEPARGAPSSPRERALRAGLASFARDESPVADAVRQEDDAASGWLAGSRGDGRDTHIASARVRAGRQIQLDVRI
jgi:hypothetical protein